MARFLPETWPIPEISRFNAPYFTTGKIMLQECASCGTIQHPPEELCHACHAMEFTARQASGRGSICSFEVIHHPGTPALRDVVPFAVVLVVLDDYPNVRIVGNVLNRRHDEIAIGQRVHAVFEEIPDAQGGVTVFLPQWEVDP
jgi:uncharacterized OB-fold protein